MGKKMYLWCPNCKKRASKIEKKGSWDVYSPKCPDCDTSYEMKFEGVEVAE